MKGGGGVLASEAKMLDLIASRTSIEGLSLIFNVMVLSLIPRYFEEEEQLGSSL